MRNNSVGALGANVLMVKEIVVGTNGSLNEPTSWFWNIRVGDKLQINGSGLWYTVVGPMVVGPAGGNSELFVNVGAPGSQSPFGEFQGGFPVFPEFLFLVNGIDDNQNGWIDEGWDGVDNNLQPGACERRPVLDGRPPRVGAREPGPRRMLQAAAALPYTIQRRPSPTASSREISLPTNVVIDMTTWANSSLTNPPLAAIPGLANGFQERSQFPPGVVNPYTGYVDILVYPNGTVVPTTIYSTPSSYGMSGAFFHFWLAERSDVHGIAVNNGVFVPIVAGQPFYLADRQHQAAAQRRPSRIRGRRSRASIAS